MLGCFRHTFKYMEWRFFLGSVWSAHASLIRKLSRCHTALSMCQTALLVICFGIHPLTLFFLLLTLVLCMPQSAVPFSMTCAFLPPQWVTVSVPLVYGCVTAQSSDICRLFRQRLLCKWKCLHLSTDWPQQHVKVCVMLFTHYTDTQL